MSADEPMVLHAYGVIDVSATIPTACPGVHGAEVELLPCGRFRVLCSRHHESDLGEQVWEANGQNPQWLADVAREHHMVLHHVVTHTDVLPLRFPSIYPNDDALCQAIDRSSDALATAFDVVRDHVEWGLKIFQAQAPANPPTQPRPASGHDYLRQRAQEASRREQAGIGRQQVLLDIHEALSMAASHSAVNPVQDRALSGHEAPMLLNAAYLVPRGRRDDFFSVLDELVTRFSSDGYVLELTGPWPPYNFTHLVMRTEHA